MYKALLAFGSLVFRNMFSFPAPVSEEGDAMKDGKPIVLLTESSKTLEKLLILCYPRLSGDGFRDLDGVDGAYEAAHKYQLSGGQRQLEKVLAEPRFLGEHPHRVFAIACHHRLENIAKASALETLKLPRYVPHLSVPEYDFISGQQLRKLEDFHFHCSESISQLVTQLRDSADGRDVHYWREEADEDLDKLYTEAESNPYFPEISPAKWFTDHISAVESAIPPSPDATSVSKKLAEISGPTVAAMSKCAKCPTLAPFELSYLARSVEKQAKEAHQGILAEFSFTE
ncbi:hypothetical protein C8R45DRAFT_1187919 [Mycena sanguinolenta]|nr:hypothetical protein C8R45DRAFT_1187919 [Mycena sanguinolenta]